MSKYNEKRKSETVENLAGGQAFKLSYKNELITFLFSSFMKNDSFYQRDEEETLRNLVKKINDKKFLAKATIYARNVLGMRSVTHALAGELVKSYSNISGQEWVKEAIEKIVRRPDDITEILSYYLKDEKKLPKGLVKGLRKSFDKFNAYSLAKYQNKDKEVSLIDAVRLLNVKPCETNAKALEDLVYGKLKSFDTWEVEISKAGSNKEAKSEAWKKLLLENKLGYMALLKNLVNLINNTPDLIDIVCKKLTDREVIKKSLVLPFRFYTAYETVCSRVSESVEKRKVLSALSKALDISLDNVKPLKGSTLVVMDTSGSMGSVQEKAGIFAAILAKVNNADLMFFDDTARYVSYNPASTTIDIVNSFHYDGGGTDFNTIFDDADKKYDNIIILSDMQGWVGYYAPTISFNRYKHNYKANPDIYSFDLAGYGTSEFPENNVFLFSGWSEKVFDLMSLLKKDRKAIIKTIESIEL